MFEDVWTGREEKSAPCPLSGPVVGSGRRGVHYTPRRVIEVEEPLYVITHRRGKEGEKERW